MNSFPQPDRDALDGVRAYFDVEEVAFGDEPFVRALRRVVYFLVVELFIF
jgi:hypothetical protein